MSPKVFLPVPVHAKNDLESLPLSPMLKFLGKPGASRSWTTGLIATAFLLGACGSGDDDEVAKKVEKEPATESTALEVTTTTVAPEPEYRSFVAHAKASVTSVMIYDTPGGEQKKLDLEVNGSLQPVAISNPINEFGTPLAFLVKTPNIVLDDEVYHEVYLPVRPNQSTGYIKGADVDIFYTDFSVEIDLGDKTLSVYSEGEVSASYPVAIGTDANKTPQGKFYLKELLDLENKSGGYGPLAYGLSGHSDSILNSDEFPDGVIGIHGTNKPELIGQAVSHGCVRMENSTILELAAMELPLGTPVTIQN